MSAVIGGQTESAKLELDFKILMLDELVILACGFAGYVTAEQMEANIGRMVGYRPHKTSIYGLGLSRGLSISVARLTTSQHLAYYDEAPNESGVRGYILTEKGRQRKIEIFNNFVDSMPKPMRDALLKRGIQ